MDVSKSLVTEKKEVQQKVKFFSLNTRMIPAKLVYILTLGAIGSYGPYLNIFLVSVGLSTSQAGMVSGFRFLTSPISTPLIGMLIDRTGRRALIFIILVLGVAIPVASMPLVAYALTSPGNNQTGIAENSLNLYNRLFPGHRHHREIIPSKALFYVMFVIMMVAGFFSVPLAGLIDSVVMNVIKTGKTKTAFGAQRVVGSISFAVTNVIAGVASQTFAKCNNNVLSHYSPIFALYMGLMILLIPSGLYLLRQADWKADAVTETPSTKISTTSKSWGNLVSLLLNFDSIIFLASVFVSGVCYNLFLGYVFLYLRDELQVDDLTMTLAIVSSSASEVVTFLFTSKLIRAIGNRTLAISIGIFSYFIRFTIMSQSPSIGLIIAVQLLHGIGFSLSWAAQIEHVQATTPTEVKTTMFTVLASLHFAVAGFVANFVGGELYSAVGGNNLFLGVGIFCLVWTGVMVVNYNVSKYRRRVQSPNTSEEKLVKDTVIAVHVVESTD